MGKIEGEEWRSLESVGIKGYEASNMGRIRKSGRGKPIVHSFPDRQGYRIINLNSPYNRKARVHRLVASVWCENDNPEINVVDHINGIKDDNRAENLRWVTKAENARFKNEQGLCAQNRKGYVLAIDRDTNEAKIYKSVAQFIYDTGVKAKAAYQAITGMRKYVSNYMLVKLVDVKGYVYTDETEDKLTCGRNFTEGSWAEIRDDDFMIKLTDLREEGFAPQELKPAMQNILNYSKNVLQISKS